MVDTVHLSRRSGLLGAAALLGWASLGRASAQPVPIRDLSGPEMAEALRVLRSADLQGLKPWPEAGASAPRGQAAVQQALIAYAEAQHGLRLPRSAFPKNWALRPPPYDAREALQAALAGNQFSTWLADLPPPDHRYGELVRMYGRYLAIARQGGWSAIPAGPRLTLSSSGPRVSALVQRLAVEDEATDLRSAGGRFGPEVEAAVKRAQERYGLDQTGAVDAALLKALNVPVSERLMQFRANLERWRWIDRRLPDFRLELNTASQQLALFDGAKPELAMRVIVGKAASPTPMFTDRVTAVVFNPPWNVPDSIARKELWPSFRKHPGRMQKEGFVVKPDGRLQQKPGPKCSLGVIKFDLGNSFGVYLHDTPARSLFGRDARALSHGCMRLEKPNALAARLLRDDPDWSEAKINMVLLTPSTTRVPVARPVPLFVVYRTVFVAHGAVRFRRDIYGWDAELTRLLDNT